MNKNIQPIDENSRNINWEEVENKIAIICNKFRTSVEERFLDDLAQELRIHAYYKSDDYYDLQRKAIDFWRSLKVNVMPEMPYFDLELVGGTHLQDFGDVEFERFVSLIKKKLTLEMPKKYDNEIRDLAREIFDIILSDVSDGVSRVKIRDWVKYAPYHNKRISCSYLWEVMGDEPGSINYQRIRKAMKMIENIIRELHESGLWDVDERYL